MVDLSDFRARRRRLAGCIVTVVVALLLLGEYAKADGPLIGSAEIKRISPKAKPALIEAFVAAEDAFAEAGINSPLRMAHFIAQVMTETGGMQRIDENMNYSYPHVLTAFSRKTLPDPMARALAGKPREMANWVYGARLGNKGRTTDDGWNYRGSGYIQLTGAATSARAAPRVGCRSRAIQNWPEVPPKA
jgi:putative chitinase